MQNFSFSEPEFDERETAAADAVDRFEGYMRAHAKRIAVLADALAQKFNFASHDRQSLRQAALFHDIGEMLMDREYIKSNRSLREEERVDLQRHPVIGEQEAAKRGLNRAVQLLIRWHHEWWNGTGYPDALSREQIPLAARILRVVDSYAALTETRPYREAFSPEEAKQFLIRWAGIEFDPLIVKTFLDIESSHETDSREEPSSAVIDREDEVRDQSSFIN